ncbi:DUF4783 domain-containing protein [Bacteroides sp. 519]|uniref:DUF4783 domain-containing protein n=1 Tax=Bacteroides sp. 519 TaxID=2302937 RepID=UPI0013D2DAC9|nr:DUF4783 domain-containing protein [Bacteroides sp. 519]NDV59801.1 DUF4783 domain-containing protein [Bacteroides sp. 519]
MEKKILLLITGLLFTTLTVWAQAKPVGVIVAFKKGSATELSTYLGDKLDLSIQNRSGNVDKQKATTMLDAFFTQNKVKSFNVNHEGTKGESSFFIGTLVTETEKFRVNCFFKRIQNKYLIHQIRIDKANE